MFQCIRAETVRETCDCYWDVLVRHALEHHVVRERVRGVSIETNHPKHYFGMIVQITYVQASQPHAIFDHLQERRGIVVASFYSTFYSLYSTLPILLSNLNLNPKCS